MRFITGIAAITALLLVPANSYGDDAADPRSRDLLMLTNWFDGEFDNEEQIWFEQDPRSATPEALKHERLHVIHRRIDAPQFGEHVFYVEEYTDNDATNIGRQRLVIFTSDPDEHAIRMRQGFFRDAKAMRGAHDDVSKIAQLTADDTFFAEGCDVFWHRVADQFVGMMKPKACVFGEGEKRRYSVHNLTLSSDKYWRVDETYLTSDDSQYVGHPNSEAHKMRRSKRFTCGIIFRNEDGTSQRVDGLSNHSQGGTVEAVRDADGQRFTLLLRDKEYPYYSERPDFMYFSVRRAGERRSVAFSVHDVRSRTIGVSVPELVAFCNLDGYQFQESYDEIL